MGKVSPKRYATCSLTLALMDPISQKKVSQREKGEGGREGCRDGGMSGARREEGMVGRVRK